MEASVWASPYGGLQQLQQQQQQQPIWRPPAAGTNLWRGTQSLKLAESSSCWHTLLTACQLAEATANAMLVRTRWSRGHAGPAMLLAWLLVLPLSVLLLPLPLLLLCCLFIADRQTMVFRTGLRGLNQPGVHNRYTLQDPPGFESGPCYTHFRTMVFSGMGTLPWRCRCTGCWRAGSLDPTSLVGWPLRWWQRGRGWSCGSGELGNRLAEHLPKPVLAAVALADYRITGDRPLDIHHCQLAADWRVRKH